ncbi:hypothetical protein [Umezawaea sp.]|uniref:hypothetical protein n=1 Tax=Umezawaea sp. TaxID=1955258 RepID=UPI002ED41E76
MLTPLSRLAAVTSALLSAVVPADGTWTAGPCPSPSGVTVAVDTTGAGGSGTAVRCASGDPGTARAALERAGFAVRAGAGTGSYGDRDYVCRVDGLPAAEACDGHVGGEAHWKVWRVALDPLAWRGSGTDGGPSALRVCPGGLVGFSFGVGTPERPNTMTASPEDVVGEPGWLPPTC